MGRHFQIRRTTTLELLKQLFYDSRSKNSLITLLSLSENMFGRQKCFY
jgi:hypothetical protein